MSVSIKFQNWDILATSTVLGQQHDQNSQTVTVTGDIPTGWDWYLLLGLGDQYNAYLMSQQNGVLTVLLDETALPQSGPYQLQLKGIQLDDPSVIKHTNTATVLVGQTITGNGSWSNNIGEFAQIEERIQVQAAQITQQSNAVSSLVQQAESHALRCQEAAESSQRSAEQVQSSLETINQQADACQAALSQVQDHTTQAVAAKDQAESASSAAQAAATAAQECQESAESASTQAQAYLADTQTARNETLQCAQDFQSAFANIYTKQETNDQFARALVVSTEINTSHEIFPDPGSNIVVTAYGYTEQAGEGDPSPANILPIQTVGKQLVEYTLTGTESMNAPTLGEGWYAQVFLPQSSPTAKGAASRIYCNIANWNYYIIDTVAYMNPNSRTLIFGSGYTAQYESLEAFRAMVQSRFNTGNPVKIWYEPVNAEDATGLYAPIFLNGGWQNYNATCLQLEEPLCEGDYIASSEKGTSVEFHTKKHIIFNGEEQWGYAGSDPSGHTLVLLPEGKVPGVDFGAMVCSHGKLSTTLNPGGLYIAGNNLLINPTGGQFGSILDGYSGSLADKWRAYLSEQYNAGTPFTLIYTRKDPMTYTHSSLELLSQPDQTGKLLVSSQRECSAKYNKSLTRAILELQAAITLGI